MGFEQLVDVLQDVPLMRPAQGRVLYDLVMDEGIERPLELGFAHGVSSCYLGGALRDRGTGHLTTIDWRGARSRDPSILDLLARTELEEWVTPIFAHTSYNWELLRLLERDPRPTFDFCFIDGAHRWEPDGLAFFLVDKLLEPGSWVLFDDLEWSIASSPSMSSASKFDRLSEEEKATAHVRKIFDLLVAEHPCYDDLRIDNNGSWGWARKVRPATSDDGRWRRWRRAAAALFRG